MSYKTLRLDRQICFRLYKTSRAMTRLYQPLLESLHITYPQYITMLVLWEEENIDFKDLGIRLDLKTGTLTPIIKRLEDLGYLKRVRNIDDQRKIWVQITKEGIALKDSAQRIPSLMKDYTNIDPDQYEQYVRVLDELGEVLERAGRKQREKE